jgi:hypothetical protein
MQGRYFMKIRMLIGLLTLTFSVAGYTEEAITQPLPTPKPVETNTTTQTPPVEATAQAANPINCEYKMPKKTAQVDPALVLSWAEKATIQSFNFDVAKLDEQLEALKNCYTEQGWKGFNDALQKSGNLESIKGQQFNVNSQMDGEAQFVDKKDNQWKIMLPVQVTYQNSKEKLTQSLSVTVLVGRKSSGDLGIMQLVAMSRNPTPEPQVTTTPPVSTDGLKPKEAPVGNPDTTTN